MPRLSSRVGGAVRETVQGLPPAFWWLWVGTLVNRLGTFVVPFLAFYLSDHLHYSGSFIGLALMLYGVGSAVSGPVSGALCDRIGRRPTMLGAMAGQAVAMLGLGFARGTVAIAVMSLLLGMADNASRPPNAAMMADIVAPEDRLRAFSLRYWAINLGFAIAPVVAGLVADHSYFALFVADAATTLVTALIVYLKVPESRPEVSLADRASPLPMGRGLLVPLRDGVFMTLVGANFLVALVFLQHQTTLPLAMLDDRLSPAAYGAVLAVNGVLIVGLQLPLTRVIGDRGRAGLLAVASALVGAGFGLTAFASTAPAYALTVVVWTLGEILHAPTSTAVVADLSPTHLRGSYQGVFGLSWSVASAIGPLGALVYDALGGDALWALSAVVGALAAAAYLRSAGPWNRRLAQLNEGVHPLPDPPEPLPAGSGVPVETSAAPVSPPT